MSIKSWLEGQFHTLVSCNFNGPISISALPSDIDGSISWIFGFCWFLNEMKLSQKKNKKNKMWVTFLYTVLSKFCKGKDRKGRRRLSGSQSGSSLLPLTNLLGVSLGTGKCKPVGSRGQLTRIIKKGFPCVKKKKQLLG